MSGLRLEALARGQEEGEESQRCCCRRPRAAAPPPLSPGFSMLSPSPLLPPLPPSPPPSRRHSPLLFPTHSPPCFASEAEGSISGLSSVGTRGALLPSVVGARRGCAPGKRLKIEEREKEKENGFSLAARAGLGGARNLSLLVPRAAVICVESSQTGGERGDAVDETRERVFFSPSKKRRGTREVATRGSLSSQLSTLSTLSTSPSLHCLSPCRLPPPPSLIPFLAPDSLLFSPDLFRRQKKSNAFCSSDDRKVLLTKKKCCKRQFTDSGITRAMPHRQAQRHPPTA